MNKDGVLEMNVLEGKKICFVGNSFTWFSRCVIKKEQSIREQALRENDEGYFYQLCKANGVNVSVTNWTWGAHSLKDLFGGCCAANRGCDGADHLAELKDRYFDYVVIQEGSGAPDFHNMLELAMRVFREANPDVKFIFMSHSSVHTGKNENYKEVRRSLKDLDAQGMMIADWGALVVDIFSGKTTVPGATQTYNKNSFIINFKISFVSEVPFYPVIPYICSEAFKGHAGNRLKTLIFPHNEKIHHIRIFSVEISVMKCPIEFWFFYCCKTV